MILRITKDKTFCLLHYLKTVTLLKYYFSMNGQNRSNIKSGIEVGIVKKEDQRSGKITDGIVKDILTSSPFHSHGIKVRLTSGEVGRIKEIYEE